MVTHSLIFLLVVMIDYEKVKTGENRENPKTGASIFSILSYWWLNGIFSTGSKRPLQKDDLFPLLEGEKCKEVNEKLKRLWDEKNFKRAPRKKANTCTGLPRILSSWISCGDGCHLFSSLLQLYSWSDYALVCLLALLCGLGNVLQPVFLSLLLAELLKPSRGDWLAYVYAAGICLSSLLRVLASNQFTYRAWTIPLRWKSAVVGMIYAKVRI